MLRAARLGAQGVAVGMFAAVFLVFCAKIIARYVEHAEMAWADEVCTVLFIWIVFWANTLLLSDHDHIRFDLVTNVVPEGVRRWMAVARAVLVGGVFAYATPATIDYIRFLWRERTPVLLWRLDVVYACFGAFVVSVVVRAAWQLWRLAGPRWRSAL